MVCFRYVIVNTLHNGDNKNDSDDVVVVVDDDDNNNNNNKFKPQNNTSN